MDSIKEKLKSKISKTKVEHLENIDSFDQNSISISINQPKSQLDQIRLVCSWNHKSSLKIPKLACRWYNRAQNNIQQIQGVADELYQPSILDVGTIIEITCVPELNGINYEGMPILVKTNIIKLATNTQNQANTLSNKRAKIFVDLKEYKLKGKVHNQKNEGIIIIQNSKFILNQTKFGQLNDQILSEQIINDKYPILIPNRRNKKEIKIKFNEEEYCILQTKNNQVRDVICLLVKIKATQQMMSKEAQIMDVQGKQKEAYVDISEKKTNSEESIKKEVQYKVKNASEEYIKVQRPDQPKPKISQILQISNLKQQIHKLQLQNSKISKELQQQKEKRHTLQAKTVQTKQRLQNATRNYFQLQKQLKSSEDVIADLTAQLKDYKNAQINNGEELIYYKTEIKLLKEQIDSLVRERNGQKILKEEVEKELSKYQETTNGNSNKSYQEIVIEFQEIHSKYQELELKYFYTRQQKQKLQEQIKNNKTLIETIQSQKKNIEQKYLSLSYQIHHYQDNQYNTPNLSKQSYKSSESSSLRGSKIMDYSPEKQREKGEYQYMMNQRPNSAFQYGIDKNQDKQREISTLQKQIQDLVEQKNYIKTLLQKQKKPTSRAHIKLQLFEVKKLSARLSQALMQKDMCITRLKDINKELNNSNIRLQRQCKDLDLQLQRRLDCNN